MARHIVEGRVTPTLLSELESLAIGLRSKLSHPLVQQALDRLSGLRIMQHSGSGWRKMSAEDVEEAIRRRLKG